MRIVHIFPSLNPGGAERILVHIMTHLDRSRFDVSAICLARPSGSDLERLLKQAEIPVQFLGKGPGFDPRMFLRVHRAIANAAPDVLHSHVHVLRYVLPAMVYRHMFGHRPRMLHTVHSLAKFEVEPRARWIQRLAFRDGVVPIAVAEEVSKSLTELYGIEAPLVVPNCLPVERYSCPKIPRQRWRMNEGFSPESVLLVCVAGLRPEKNHTVLLKAFAQTAQVPAGTHLLLAGGGDSTELKDLARELGIEGRVHFLGVRTDIPDLLAASDLFVLASHYEGNPLCIMEAMAAGLPVVAPNVGGIPELVTDGVQGFLITPMQPEVLAAQLSLLIKDPEQRMQMGAASAKHAQAFDVKHMVSAYERLYLASVSASATPSARASEQPS